MGLSMGHSGGSCSLWLLADLCLPGFATPGQGQTNPPTVRSGSFPLGWWASLWLAWQQGRVVAVVMALVGLVAGLLVPFNASDRRAWFQEHLDLIFLVPHGPQE